MLTRESFDKLMTEIDALRLKQVPNLYDLLKNIPVSATQLATIEAMCDGIATNLEEVGKTELGFAIVARHLTYLLTQPAESSTDNGTYFTAIKQINRINAAEDMSIRDGLLAFANVLLNQRTPNAFVEQILQAGEISAELIAVFRTTVRCVAKDTLQTIKQGKTDQAVREIIEARIGLEQQRADVETEAEQEQAELEVVLRRLFSQMAESINSGVLRVFNSLHCNSAPYGANIPMPGVTRVDGFSDAQNAYLTAVMRYNVITIAKLDDIFRRIEFSSGNPTTNVAITIHNGLLLRDLFLGDFRFNHCCDVNQHRNTLYQLEAISHQDVIHRVKQRYPRISDELCQEAYMMRMNLLNVMQALVAAREQVEPEFTADPTKKRIALRCLYIKQGKLIYNLVPGILAALPIPPELRRTLDADELIRVSFLTQGIIPTLPVRTAGYYMQLAIYSYSKIQENHLASGFDHGEGYPYDREHHSSIPPVDYQAVLRSLYTRAELTHIQAQPQLSAEQQQASMMRSLFESGVQLGVSGAQQVRTNQQRNQSVMMHTLFANGEPVGMVRLEEQSGRDNDQQNCLIM